jgi:hypothetical protein
MRRHRIRSRAPAGTRRCAFRDCRLGVGIRTRGQVEVHGRVCTGPRMGAAMRTRAHAGVCGRVCMVCPLRIAMPARTRRHVRACAPEDAAGGREQAGRTGPDAVRRTGACGRPRVSS